MQRTALKSTRVIKLEGAVLNHPSFVRAGAGAIET
jgi:hypothetical protein